jgi:hypothetical protein
VSPQNLPGRTIGLAVLLCSIVLNACSINPKVDMPELVQGTEPVLLDVPFFAQEQYQCGPAALASVLQAGGVVITPDQLVPQIYLPERQGSLQLELLAATRRAGRIPYVIENELGTVFAQLESGRPVLLLQNLRTPHFPQWHYAVLTGVDPATETAFLHTGLSRNEAMKVGKFARLWDWAGNWAVVVLQPGEIPAKAMPQPYFEAVASFEAVAGPAATEPAWRSAIQHWPDEPQAYLALGNQAYARGELETAAGLYREGLNANSLNPGLANNLASVLGELGCPRGGESLLLPVAAGLPADSAWQEIITATLAELAAKSQDNGANCAVN